MRPSTYRLTGVMQQQSQVKHERIGQFLEKFPVLDQLAVFRVRQRIQFVDTDQSVFVRSVAVEKFMLHQTGELAELGNILPKKIQPMHQAQGASDFSFARENTAKDFTGFPGVAERVRNQANFSAQHVGKLGTGFELLLLRDLNRTHHFHRLLAEEILSFHVELTIVNKKTVDMLGRRFGAREESEE